MDNNIEIDNINKFINNLNKEFYSLLKSILLLVKLFKNQRNFIYNNKMTDKYIY